MDSIQSTSDLVGRGLATSLPLSYAQDFVAFLEALPWCISGTRLDWSEVNHRTADLNHVAGAELRRWFRSTKVGRHAHLMLCHSPRVEPLLIKTKVVASFFDLIVSTIPTRVYLCAWRGGPMHADYAECDFHEIRACV